MLNKIKKLSHKKKFGLGLVLLLVGASMWQNVWVSIAGGVIVSLGFGLIIMASNEKYKK